MMNNNQNIKIVDAFINKLNVSEVKYLTKERTSIQI